MYLKSDKIVVTIKETSFRSYKTNQTAQFIIDPDGVTGWNDGAEVRRDSTVRPVSSGDFYEPSVFSSRLISVSGTAIAATPQELQELRDELTGLFVEGDYSEISVETLSGIRYATVGLEKVDWVQKIDTVAVFRLELYAPDPYLYGYEQTIMLKSTTAVGGGLNYPTAYPINYNEVNASRQNLSVTNNGNAAAWPKFVVTGDYFSGFTITDGASNRITYTGPVTYQAPVTIDTSKGAAFQGGFDKSAMLTERSWFSVQPAQILVPIFTPIQEASGWCVIMIRDTFI